MDQPGQLAEEPHRDKFDVVSASVVSGARPVAALWVAAASTTLALGLPLQGDAPGRVLSVRVFLVAAIVLTTIAAAGQLEPRAVRGLISLAIGSLVATLVLVLSGVAPAGLIALAIALAALVWVRKQPATS